MPLPLDARPITQLPAQVVLQTGIICPNRSSSHTVEYRLNKGLSQIVLILWVDESVPNGVEPQTQTPSWLPSTTARSTVACLRFAPGSAMRDPAKWFCGLCGKTVRSKGQFGTSLTGFQTPHLGRAFPRDSFYVQPAH